MALAMQGPTTGTSREPGILSPMDVARVSAATLTCRDATRTVLLKQLVCVGVSKRDMHFRRPTAKRSPIVVRNYGRGGRLGALFITDNITADLLGKTVERIDCIRDGSANRIW